MRTLLFCVLTSTALIGNSQSSIAKYNFDIDYQTVNFTGNDALAMSVGGSIPAPTIEATVGNILQVTFNNKMDVETSIHWHGILLPNDQDGVPYLTTPPIPAGESFTFEFPITHHGTYWYHSHTGLQEQRGVYGPIVFHEKTGEKIRTDYDVVVTLSDWIDENPKTVMHNLKKSDDYYSLKKDSVQSWLKVFKNGKYAIKNRLNQSWSRMSTMDISDVGYDAFLANGKRQIKFPNIKSGETIRLRIINAAASSYFNLEYAGGPMTIVSADGVDVKPVAVDRQRIAIAETFDVVLTLPENQAYEFRATSEDGTGYSSVIIGSGEILSASDIPKPNPFLMKHSIHTGTNQAMDHDMETVKGEVSSHQTAEHKNMHPEEGSTRNMDTEALNPKAFDHFELNNPERNHADMKASTSKPSSIQRMKEYELLSAIQPTSYSSHTKKRNIRLDLTGDMERYAWSFNNKVLSEDSKILIRKGEVVQFILDNKTMMHHPIHLHGHFFRVLNGKEEYAPLKHTVNVPPMQSVTIEFLANEEKDWLFHCHNLYHMKSGMTRVVSYEKSTQSTEKSLTPLFSDQDWFYFSDFGVQSNLTHGRFRAENTRNAFNFDFDGDSNDKYEAQITYERYINRFLELYVGATIEKNGEPERESVGILGLHYLLPLLIDADIRFDTDGHGQVGLGSEFQLSNRLAFSWDVNTDHEYHLQLEYELNKQIVLTGGRDSQFDWGAGIELRF